jgi:uncharacterized protein (DUF362 family)
MGKIVSLVRTKSFKEEDIKHAVYQAIDMCGFNLDSPKLVLIKPNLCYYWDYSTGETTDPRVVSSIIDYIREKVGSEVNIKIVESDASAMRTKHVFNMLRYNVLSKEKSVELLNLSTDKTVKKEVKVGKYEFVLSLPQSIFECDLFINVPKLKVGPYAGGQALHMTCALKNMFGCIQDSKKVKFHPYLNEVIVAVNKLIQPSLVVVDGVIALGQHPVKLGLIIAGTDNLTVDFVASKIMGYNPWRVKHIRLAIKEGIRGAENIKDIKIVGEDIKVLRKSFPTRNRLKFKITWTMQLWLLRLYAKLVGDIIPPVLENV